MLETKNNSHLLFWFLKILWICIPSSFFIPDVTVSTWTAQPFLIIIYEKLYTWLTEVTERMKHRFTFSLEMHTWKCKTSNTILKITIRHQDILSQTTDCNLNRPNGQFLTLLLLTGILVSVKYRLCYMISQMLLFFPPKKIYTKCYDQILIYFLSTAERNLGSGYCLSSVHKTYLKKYPNCLPPLRKELKTLLLIGITYFADKVTYIQLSACLSEIFFRMSAVYDFWVVGQRLYNQKREKIVDNKELRLGRKDRNDPASYGMHFILLKQWAWLIQKYIIIIRLLH